MIVTDINSKKQNELSLFINMILQSKRKESFIQKFNGLYSQTNLLSKNQNDNDFHHLKEENKEIKEFLIDLVKMENCLEADLNHSTKWFNDFKSILKKGNFFNFFRNFKKDFSKPIFNLNDCSKVNKIVKKNEFELRIEVFNKVFGCKFFSDFIHENKIKILFTPNFDNKNFLLSNFENPNNKKYFKDSNESINNLNFLELNYLNHYPIIFNTCKNYFLSNITNEGYKEKRTIEVDVPRSCLNTIISKIFDDEENKENNKQLLFNSIILF